MNSALFDQQKDMIQQKLGLSFDNDLLVQQCFTHKSLQDKPNNERLEFLGDRLLSLILSEYLYHYTQNNEGLLSQQLHQLIDKYTLSSITTHYKLHEFLCTEQIQDKESDNVKADLLEAIIALIYIEHGLEQTKKFVLTLWHEKLQNLEIYDKDPRSYLQEFCQKNGQNIPIYQVIQKKGEDHKPEFLCEVSCFIGQETSWAMSKKQGYKQCALALIKHHHL